MLRPPPALADSTAIRRAAAAARGDRSGCFCSSHCPNSCEPGCCPPGTPWCRCWHHRVELRREVRRLKALRARDDDRIAALGGVR